MKKLATILVIISLIASVFMVSPIVSGASVNGEGYDRSVVMDVSDENWTSTANLTLPEEISENHTLSGNITYENINNYSATPDVNYWVNVTISNSTWSNAFTTDTINMTENNTKTYEITVNVPIGEYNATTSLETDTGASDIQSDENITVVSNISWTVGAELMPMIGLFIMLMFMAIVIKQVVKMFKNPMSNEEED